MNADQQRRMDAEYLTTSDDAAQLAISTGEHNDLSEQDGDSCDRDLWSLCEYVSRRGETIRGDNAG